LLSGVAGALQERLGLGVTTLLEVQDPQVVEGRGDRNIARSECLLCDLEAAL
jgi:hypothetical protein